MRTKFLNVPCDVCGSKEKKKIGIPNNRLALKTTINIPVDVCVVRCKKCGFYYTDPMPFWGEEDVKKLYDIEYFDQNTDWWKNIRYNVNPTRRLDLIEKLSVRKISRFLEVGCGEGICLRQAVRRGWEGFGEDVSPDLAAIAKRIPNVDIFVGTLESAKYPDNYFDVVYLDSVIEHVPQPTMLIREIHRILRPDGLVYIVCPNEDALVIKIRQTLRNIKSQGTSAHICPFSNPYHINGFSKKALKMFAKENLFNVKHILVDKDYRAFENRKYNRRNNVNLRDSLLNSLYFVADFIGLGTNLEGVLSAEK